MEEFNRSIMIWGSVGLLVLCSSAYVWLYVLSVRPAALERRLGEVAWKRCAAYRQVCYLLGVAILGCYGWILACPPPFGMPHWFPWPWWWSALAAGVCAVPAVLLWWAGVRDAGGETVEPEKSRPMFRGVYRRMRHPQAVGGYAVWVLIGLGSHSPFLAVYSLLWIPVCVFVCHAEERDLILRFGSAYEEYCRKTNAFWPGRGSS